MEQNQGDHTGIWTTLLDTKPVEFWVALIGAAIYVYLSSKETGHVHRWFMVASSAMLGFSLSGDFSLFTGLGETFSGVLVTVFGYVLIDMTTALLKDRTFLKQLIVERFSKK